jgi:hypothetical protein
MEMQLRHPAIRPVLRSERERGARDHGTVVEPVTRQPAVMVLAALLMAPFALITASARWLPALPEEG